MSSWLDSFLSGFRWWRKLRGGKWECWFVEVCCAFIWTKVDEYSKERPPACHGTPFRECWDEAYPIIKQKDGVYAERDQLVAALSKLFPASLERHPENEEWEDDWRWIVFIDLPTGQASWHIHDSELYLFDHLQRNAGRKWDGHTTTDKYFRLNCLQFGGQK